MNHPTTIGLLGATGFTGELVARVLHRENLPFLLAGRDGAKLASLRDSLAVDAPTCVVDLANPASLRTLTSAVGVLINCAGPYTDFGSAVIEAALDTGIHVLDLNGEQPFLQHCLERFDTLAYRRGIAIATAMGVEGAIADCMATIAVADLDAVDTIITATAARDFRTTRGTRLSRMRLLTQENWAYEDGRWQSSTLMWPHNQAIVRRFRFAPPIRSAYAVWLPSVCLLTIPRHIVARRVITYYVIPTPIAMIAVGARPFLEALRLTPLAQFFEQVFQSYTHDPGSDHRHATFQIIVEARGQIAGQPATRRLLASGRDPYGLSAEMIVAAARWLLEDGPSGGRGGVLAPACAVDPRRLLNSLSAHGLLILDD